MKFLMTIFVLFLIVTLIFVCCSLRLSGIISLEEEK